MVDRRQFLQTGAGTVVLRLAGAAGLLPAAAQAAWNKAAFEGKDLAGVVKALGGAAPVESKELRVLADEIAENGNMVRVGAASSLPGTTQLAILVEKNPSPLAGVFDLPEGTEAQVLINVKMAETSNVYVLARAADRYYYAVKTVTVTLGGCGA
jgi:sulfur-oxidizing protein SoxY